MNYTKIAFITDIHGNPYALESVLKKIDQLNVDQIFCGGDQVAIGPFSNEVMEILTSREDVQCVHGNHDLCVLAIFHNQPYPRSHAHAYEHHEWIARNLDPKWIPFMNTWKREIQIKVGGKPTLVTHYGYVKELLHAPIDREPYKNIVEPSKENMVELYKEKNEDILLFGHHHPLHYFQVNGTYYINPGALGCHNKGEAPFCILTSRDVKFYTATYPYESFIESYNRLNVPSKDELLSIFFSTHAK